MAKTDSVPVRMPEELAKEIEATAKELGISKQDIIRQAIQLGLPAFTRAISRAMAEARGETEKVAA